MPRDTTIESGDQVAGSGLVQALLRRMTPEARDSFTPAQVALLQHAAADNGFGSHALDIRFTLPLFGRDFYFVMLGGRERRSLARRRAERSRHPLAKAANLVFLAGLGAVSTVVGGIAFTSLFIWYLSTF